MAKTSTNGTLSQATFPRWFLVGVAALVASSVMFAGITRLTGFGVSRVSQTEIAQSIEIRFAEQSNGSMHVLRSSDGALLTVLASDGSGFLRGVVRSLNRQRLLGKIERGEPYQLARRVDGKLFIADPALGSRMELDGFGPSNTQSIAEVLETGLGISPSKTRDQQMSSINRTTEQGRAE